MADTFKDGIEAAERVAERDVDWTRFGQRDLDPWDGGPDSARDYRLGIRVGRVIAAEIRALRPPEPAQDREATPRLRADLAVIIRAAMIEAGRDLHLCGDMEQLYIADAILAWMSAAGFKRGGG